MGFLSGVSDAINIGTGLIGLGTAGKQLIDPEDNKELQRISEEQRAAQEFANRLARGRIPGSPEYEQVFEPYLDLLQQQQHAALRLGHREQERERQRQMARGVLSSYAIGGRQLATQDADREMSFRALDYPQQVLARHEAVGSALNQAAGMATGDPRLGFEAQQTRSDLGKARFPIAVEGAQLFQQSLPSWENVLSGQSSGQPYTLPTRLPGGAPYGGGLPGIISGPR